MDTLSTPSARIDHWSMDSWGWRRLLQVSAGSAFVLLALANVLFGPDPIFLSFAVLMLAGVVLTRWRTRIGSIVILIPSLAGLAFAAASGYFVATHPVAFWDLSSALFALLPLAAAVNLVAVFGIFLAGRVGALQQPVIPTVVGGLAIAVVVLVAGLGAVARVGVAGASSAQGDLRLDAKDIKFSKESLDSASS